jgi:TPR repeat protein
MWNDEESREVFKAFRQGGRRATQLLKGYVKNGNAYAMVVLALRKRTAAEDTIDLLKHATRIGNVHAQFLLGLQYLHGTNIKKNRPLAVKLIAESANRGSISAAMWLTDFFLNDEGPEKNFKEGIVLLNKVANRQEYNPCIHKKEIEACHSYAEYIQLMEGYAIAVAHENLYLMYKSGLYGLPQDDEQAAYWLAKLYDYGLTDAAWELVALYKKLLKNEPTEPILEALVKKDDPEAMLALAYLWKQSNDRDKQHHAFNLEQRGKKLKIAAAPRPPASPLPPCGSPTYRSPRIASNRLPRVAEHGSDQWQTPLQKLQKAIISLKQSPPDYAKAHKILNEPDMLHYPPAKEHRDEVIKMLRMDPSTREALQQRNPVGVE